MEGRSNISTVWGRVSDILIQRGEGVYLYDDRGKRYIDFTSGIGVTNTGHCHPKVVDAIRDQAGRLIFGQLNIVYHEPVFSLIGKLTSIVPAGLDRFFFSNSGAEAVEGAVKLAKQVSRRQNVIVFHGSFHGRTHLTMAMTTSKTVYRHLYQPLVPGIFVAPYPYAYYYGWSEKDTLSFCLQELDRILHSQTAPEETACIVIEPVLGEGGYVVPPKGFLPALRRICDEYGILLIADEIQSGLGRTGEWFALQHEQVVPDILTAAKGLASGMPLSCIAYRAALDEKWITGSHGGTYGGNPVACAAAAATIDVIREENLLDNARERGDQLVSLLRECRDHYPCIGDVRGQGLMVATEFVKDGRPDKETVTKITRECRERGLILLSCGTWGNIIRWIPPLITTGGQIEEGVRIFRSALEHV